MEMMTMKKTLSVLLVFVLGASLIGCAANEPEGNDEINVGVAFYPMKDILLLIEDDLAEEGFDLVINEFSDYQVPNNLLQNGELDANIIQHDYFLQIFNESNDADLVTVQPIYHATFALYSRDYVSLDEIPEGSSITMADDATNFSRSLYLLGQAGLLTFNEGKTTGLTLEDIASNPKNLQFEDKVPLTSLAQRYSETGLAVMYPTYARSLELVGDEQRLYVEQQDDVTEGYAISLVARNDNRDSEKIQALIKHITSDEVREFLIDEYSWASKPAF
jgi:D-methionine transport system substrate-binding protein